MRNRGAVTTIPARDRLSSGRFETPAILKALALAGRKHAELKGVAASIPNQNILVNTADTRLRRRLARCGCAKSAGK
jgi:hypothetical protein